MTMITNSSSVPDVGLACERFLQGREAIFIRPREVSPAAAHGLGQADLEAEFAQAGGTGIDARLIRCARKGDRGEPPRGRTEAGQAQRPHRSA
jgi:hypothetical protein